MKSQLAVSSAVQTYAQLQRMHTQDLENSGDVEPYPNLKNSTLGPQKSKNEPEIKLKSKVRIEGTIENISCSTK